MEDSLNVSLIPRSILGAALGAAVIVTASCATPPPASPTPANSTTPPSAGSTTQGDSDWLPALRYRAENLRIVPVFGPNALDISPRIGHIHVTVDGSPWHWADASGEPLIIQGLPPGPHTVLVELAEPTHRVIDSRTISLEIPPRDG
jgi:hypothetical protein